MYNEITSSTTRNVRGGINLKIKYIKQQLSTFITKHLVLFLISASLVILGIVIGVITYNSMDLEAKNKLFSFMQNYFIGSILIGTSNIEIFKSVLADNLFLSLTLLVSGLSVFLCPIAYLRIASKGFGIGLTACLFITRYKVKGALFFLISTILNNTITVPAIIIFTIASSVLSYKLHIELKNDKALKHRFKISKYRKYIFSYLAYFLLLAFALFLASLVQTFISPGIMEMLYMQLSNNA